MTKENARKLFAYEDAPRGSRLDNVYGRYSVYKARAEKMILDEMESVGGYDYRITSHNCSFFSCAYRFVRDGVEYLVYHTASSRAEFPIPSSHFEN